MPRFRVIVRSVSYDVLHVSAKDAAAAAMRALDPDAPEWERAEAWISGPNEEPTVHDVYEVSEGVKPTE